MSTLEYTKVALDTSVPHTRFFCDVALGTWREVHYLRYDVTQLYSKDITNCILESSHESMLRKLKIG